MSGDHVIRIHQDELEYTSDGLKTTEAIPLEVGRHNKVVIRRAERRRAVLGGLGAFPVGSAFPTPGFLALLIGPSYGEFFAGLLGDGASSLYQVFGHAEPDGDEQANKALSERRAKVALALLQGDVEAFESAAKQESWGVAEDQVMLRVLGCDPGVVDATPGRLTAAATRLFQSDYNARVFHARSGLELKCGELSLDGVLSDATREALRESLVVGCSLELDGTRLHPHFPAVGCSEYNAVESENGAYSRRVSLVVHPSLPEFADRAPCTEGDHSACPAGDAPPSRCFWYRDHVLDPLPEECPEVHFDLSWLPLPNGRVLLSALTTLADDEPVTFQVFRSNPIGRPEDISPEALGDPLSERLDGLVKLGVAQVVWEPSEGFDPFDVDDWFEAVDYAAACTDGVGPQRLTAPLFEVRSARGQALSAPPGRPMHRIHVELEDGSAPEAATVARGVDAFGRTFQIALERERGLGGFRPRAASVPAAIFEPLSHSPARPTDES